MRENMMNATGWASRRLLAVILAGLAGLAGAADLRAGSLSVQSGSKYSGNFGLQVTPDATPAFVQSSHPSAERTYRVRFYVNLTRLNLASNSQFDLFVAYNGADPAPSAAPTGNPVVRLAIRQDGLGAKFLDVFTRTNAGIEVQLPSSPVLANGWRAVEFEWAAATAPGANNGVLNLWLDGSPGGSLTGLASDTQLINYARWGSVSPVSLGAPAAIPNANTFKLDEFGSQRQGYLGLVNVFSDVAGVSSSIRQYIHAIYNAGLTNGCSVTPLSYCPDLNLTRAEIAKFLELGMRGETFDPPALQASSFSDVPSTHWGLRWIEQLHNDGVTNGCATNPLRYCPDNPVSWAEMAKFLLIGKHGLGYVPPHVTASSFSDVPNYWARDWIEELYVEGITNGCGTAPLRYCPDALMTRWQLAKALALTFSLPVPNGL